MRYLLFSDYKIRRPLKHSSCAKNSREKQFDLYIIQTVSTKILSIFLTQITSLRTILIILTLILVFQIIVNCSHCVLIENPVFELLGHIALKLSQKVLRKMIKDQHFQRRVLLQDSAPKNSKFHRLDPILIFYILRKIK